MKKILLSITICLVFAGNIFSQEKEISSDESGRQLRAAFAKFSEVSWRKKQKTEYFQDGKLVNTVEITEESQKPDSWHSVTINNKDGIVSKTEFIRIGTDHYCQQNNEGWERSEEGCIQRAKVLAMEEVETKYTVRTTTINGQKASLYRRYVIYEDGAKGLSYWDYKFWISEEGFILRREIVTGSRNTKEIYSRMTEISQINPKDLKIEAPVAVEKTK